jgi:(E)-4-hydroxy-3-methylbut-2-enyl-diphosphate synthase
VAALEERVKHISVPMNVSIIGCVVNGPGEAKLTDIGFTGGGNGTHQVYLQGVPAHRLQNADIVEHVAGLIEAKAKEIAANKAA